jgi:hypothetical protein
MRIARWARTAPYMDERIRIRRFFVPYTRLRPADGVFPNQLFQVDLRFRRPRLFLRFAQLSRTYNALRARGGHDVSQTCYEAIPSLRARLKRG